MRIGLAGVGRIGAVHAETLMGLVNTAAVDTLLVADAEPALATKVANELGARAVDDTDALFAAAPDALVVATATDAHAPLVLQAVDAGIPVFCEKPVAPDLAGTLAVLSRVREADVAIQVGFQRRFDAGYAEARRAVGAGELGWVHTLRASTLDPAPPSERYLAGSGGLYRDCCVHDFDIVRWVTGREFVEAYALGANRGEEFVRRAGDVDTAAALLTLDDGAFVQVSATRYNAAGYDVRLEVLGSAAGVAVGLDERLPLRSAEPGTDFPAGPPYPQFMQRFRHAYVAELAAFVEVAAGRAPSPCTVADALEAFRVAEACERSRLEHRPVRLEEVPR